MTVGSDRGHLCSHSQNQFILDGGAVQKSCRYFETLRSKREEAGSFKRLKFDCLTLFIMNDCDTQWCNKEEKSMFTELCGICLSVCLSPRGKGEEKRNLPLL